MRVVSRPACARLRGSGGEAAGTWNVIVLLPSVSISVSASAMVCAIVASLSLCRAAEACARLNKKSPHKGYARMGPSERAEATREACDGGDNDEFLKPSHSAVPGPAVFLHGPI